MKRVKLFLIAAVALLIGGSAINAQIVEPVSWDAKVVKLETGEYLVTYTATIDAGWSIYDFGPYKGGPLATTFTLEENEDVELIGKVTPKVKVKKKHDPVWNMEIGKFVGKTEFTQKVKKIGKGDVEFTMNVEWQACDDSSCIAPTDEDLTVTLK